MNKIMFSIVFLLISLSIECFTQEFNPKYYSSSSDGDYKSGYSGIAGAIFIENYDPLIAKNMLTPVGRELSKLTKNNSWLCQKALNEWELKKGEVYIVICANSSDSQEAIMLFATIIDDKGNFSWWGKILTTEDVKKIMNSSQ